MEEKKSNFLGRTNSWHWLAICLAISLVVAGYYAKDLWQRAVREDLQRVVLAEKNLATLKALDPDEPERLLREQRNFEKQSQAVEAQIQKLGLEAMPTNAACVFAVQNELGAAMAKRHLRVVSTSAADRTPVAPKAAATPAKASKQAAAAATPTRQMTADEYQKASMEVINTLNGSEKEMALKDLNAKLAKMRRFEAEEAKRAALNQKSAAKPVARKTVVASTASKRAAAAFQTENLAYEVAGSFRDIFMFFVEESYRRPAYNFSDIRVVPGESEGGPMKLFFTLQVNWK